MRKNHFYILSFLTGLIVAFSICWIQKKINLTGYQSSNNDRILKFDPYKYQAKTKAAISYFYNSIPQVVRTELENKYPNFEYRISCEGDLIPGGKAEIAVSSFTENISHVVIFELEDETKIKNTIDISKLINFERKGPDDYLELLCRHADYILSSATFHLDESEKDLAEDLQQTNRELLEVKSRKSDTYGVFAYDLKDKKFHQIGTAPADR